jgi:mannose-6-phosphate isomerase-like protein (cupin superfamily)
MTHNPQRISVIPAGGGSKSVHPGGTIGYNVLTKAMTGGSHGVVIADAVVGAAPPYHRHTADETFIILEGTFEAISDGHSFVVEPGGVVYIPGGTPHTIRCTKPGPRGVGKTIVILAPAGLEGFFDEIEALRAAGEHPTPQRLAEIAAPYGIEFVDDPRHR